MLRPATAQPTLHGALHRHAVRTVTQASTVNIQPVTYNTVQDSASGSNKLILPNIDSLYRQAPALTLKLTIIVPS